MTNCRLIGKYNANIKTVSNLLRDPLALDADCFRLSCVGNAIHDMSDNGRTFLKKKGLTPDDFIGSRNIIDHEYPGVETDVALVFHLVKIEIPLLLSSSDEYLKKNK